MNFKLMETQAGRWRRINGPHLGPLVRAGAEVVNGVLVKENKEKDAV
jgi:hypothetical protein